MCLASKLIGLFPLKLSRIFVREPATLHENESCSDLYTPRGSFDRLLTFYIVTADRNIGVTALTQRHKIFIVVCAAVCKREDVVHFRHGRQPAILFALFA